MDTSSNTHPRSLDSFDSANIKLGGAGSGQVDLLAPYYAVKELFTHQKETKRYYDEVLFKEYWDEEVD